MIDVLNLALPFFGLIFIGFVFENLMGFYVIEAAWGIYLFGMLTSVVAVNGISLSSHDSDSPSLRFGCLPRHRRASVRFAQHLPYHGGIHCQLFPS